jgi:uncharacterized protein (TIRG00374 family)
MKKVIIKILITLAIAGGFVYFLVRNFADIRNTYEITVSNITGYLLLALFFLFLTRLFVGILFKKTFAMAGLKRTVKEMFILDLEAMAINLVVPTAGFSVAVLFADDAKKRNESRTTAINGTFITMIVDYTAICILLFLAVVYLAIIGSLTSTVIAATITFFLITTTLYILSFLAAHSEKFLKKLLIAIGNKIVFPIVRRFKKGIDFNSIVEKFITELSDVHKAVLRTPKNLFIAIFWALAGHLTRIIILYIVFISLGFAPQYRALLTGYAIGAVIVIVSPTPNGIGFVEGSMVLTFSSLGIPAAVATTATIIYRAIEFWIPFLSGFLLLQRENVKRIKEEIFGS